VIVKNGDGKSIKIIFAFKKIGEHTGVEYKRIFLQCKEKMKENKKQISEYIDPIKKIGFRKGNPGKKPGTLSKPNKPFVSLKHSFLDAFNDPRIGGTEGVIRWVLESPRHESKRRRIFYAWIVRMLPRTVDVEKDSNLDNMLEKWKASSNEELLSRARDVAKELSRVAGTGNGSSEEAI